MNPLIDPPRPHPAARAAIVAGSLAFSAGALVAIAYMLGWIPSKPQLPSAPTSMANPGQQVAGSAPDVALLPGETLVDPADTPQPSMAGPARATPPAAPRPTAPRYATASPTDPAKPPAAPRDAMPPIYAQPVPPPSPPASSAQALPSRAAPSRPNYTRNEIAARTPNERSVENVCVNCGAIVSIGSSGPDWEVRVRFDDGSSESLRYPERPRLRIGDRVHLEDGRLIPD
jgi:hypothetical protein